MKFTKKNDEFHRETGYPAIIWENGDMEWYLDGQRFRPDNKPTVERGNGIKM